MNLLLFFHVDPPYVGDTMRLNHCAKHHEWPFANRAFDASVFPAEFGLLLAGNAQHGYIPRRLGDYRPGAGQT